MIDAVKTTMASEKIVDGQLPMRTLEQILDTILIFDKKLDDAWLENANNEREMTEIRIQNEGIMTKMTWLYDKTQKVNDWTTDIYNRDIKEMFNMGRTIAVCVTIGMVTSIATMLILIMKML